MKKIGIPFIISAPSGAGKTSLIKTLCEQTTQMVVSISHTTRKQRPGEIDGINYHFVDKPTFEALIVSDNFLEYANVFGHYYGTSSVWLNQQLQAGIDVLLDIDWQGAQQVKQKLPQSIGIFILPPSLEILRKRLISRAQDKPEIIESRMAQAKNEISHYQEFDYLVVNDNFQQAVTDIQSIIRSQHMAKIHRENELDDLISDLLGSCAK